MGSQAPLTSNPQEAAQEEDKCGRGPHYFLELALGLNSSFLCRKPC